MIRSTLVYHISVVRLKERLGFTRHIYNSNYIIRKDKQFNNVAAKSWRPFCPWISYKVALQLVSSTGVLTSSGSAV